jgi:hypothetical protein
MSMDAVVVDYLRQEARAKADLAKHAMLPHVLYGARVWKANPQDRQRGWACGIVYDYNDGNYWVVTYPVGYGMTPEGACKAFDYLWRLGEEVDEKPKEQQP